MSTEKKDYYDILILGKTGFGKSTTANKLLGVELTSPEELESASQDYYHRLTVWGKSLDKRLYNVVGNTTHAVTEKCKLISNESSSIRVLDVPGFADTKQAKLIGVVEANLQTLRWVMRNQDEHDLEFSRVMYFLPFRGPPPSRIDGNQQEEIKCMHEVYGDVIFDNMVLVVTQHDRESYQSMGYGEDEKSEVQKYFIEAFHEITGANLSNCPPIVYLQKRAPQNEVQDAIKSASVLKPESKIRLKFKNRCIRCGVKICLEGPQPTVQNKAGDIIMYDQSKCHPTFIPKHYTITKIIGGMGHLATLGTFVVLGKLVGNPIWPGFTNSQEICPICNKNPGSPGCTLVHQLVTVGSSNDIIKTDHSFTLDEVKMDK